MFRDFSFQSLQGAQEKGRGTGEHVWGWVCDHGVDIYLLFLMWHVTCSFWKPCRRGADVQWLHGVHYSTVWWLCFLQAPTPSESVSVLGASGRRSCTLCVIWATNAKCVKSSTASDGALWPRLFTVCSGNLLRIVPSILWNTARAAYTVWFGDFRNIFFPVYFLPSHWPMN